MPFEQQGKSCPVQSDFVVHCTHFAPSHRGVEPEHAAQLEPQCASTVHAAHAFAASQYSPAGQPLEHGPPLLLLVTLLVLDALVVEVDPLPELVVVPELLVALLVALAPPAPELELDVGAFPPVPPPSVPIASWQRPDTQTCPSSQFSAVSQRISR